jgi:Holliday junction DNA helicase RuvB
MEDFKIDIMIESGPNARELYWQLNLNPFTLIGATTRSGLLTAPIRARFSIYFSTTMIPMELLTTIVEKCIDTQNANIDGSLLSKLQVEVGNTAYGRCFATSRT